MHIPEGHVYYMMPTEVSYLYNIKINIGGYVYVNGDYLEWPLEEPGKIKDFWTITDSTNIIITGNGTVDG